MSWNWCEVSSLSSHPRQKPEPAEWAARLIPGGAPASHGGKKVAKGTIATLLPGNWAVPICAREKHGSGVLARVLPRCDRGKGSGHWLRHDLQDYVLVMFDWLLVARIYVRLHLAFPRALGVPELAGRLHVASTVIAIALLHGLLVNLLNRPEKVQPAGLQVQTKTLGRAVFWGTLVVSAALQLQGFSALAVAAVWSAGILNFATLWAWRWTERNADQDGFRAAQGTRNVLIIGAGALGRRIAHFIENHPEIQRSVCGFLDDKKPLGNGVVGRTSDLAEMARTRFVDELIVAAPHDQELTLRVLHAARRLHLDMKVAPDLFGCEATRETESIGRIPLISLHQERLPVLELLAKRVLDVAIAGAGYILMAPVFLLIAVLIKLDSPGSVLYVAPRAGRKGRTFRCYKFRTMVRDADSLKQSLRGQNQRSGPFFKITSDPRVTRVGRYLRRYSLDELPQLWNVLKGEMSLVGPRPHPLDDVSAYAIEHLPRLDVTPGITGLWQVTARQDPSFQTGMHLDREYINSWSLGMDLRILLKTAGAVFRGTGN
jgi:exopolysaccharide biosynthesis polyprenyl glycosylphosphotransferase